MAVYTRTGDFGETSLFGGKRVLKCDDSVELYGLIDELNSYIGLIISELTVVEVQEFLQQIQKDLCTIGSYFAGASVDFHFIDTRIKEMEARIDKMDNVLPRIDTFILPGGTKLASLIHITRSIARRVERRAVYSNTSCSDHPERKTKRVKETIAYLNRLSDFFFIFARFMNKQENVIEVAWKETKKAEKE